MQEFDCNFDFVPNPVFVQLCIMLQLEPNSHEFNVQSIPSKECYGTSFSATHVDWEKDKEKTPKISQFPIEIVAACRWVQLLPWEIPMHSHIRTKYDSTRKLSNFITFLPISPDPSISEQQNHSFNQSMYRNNTQDRQSNNKTGHTIERTKVRACDSAQNKEDPSQLRQVPKYCFTTKLISPLNVIWWLFHLLTSPVPRLPSSIFHLLNQTLETWNGIAETELRIPYIYAFAFAFAFYIRFIFHFICFAGNFQISI